MSESNKFANVDYRLKNLTNALYLDGNDDVVMRTGFAGNIVISGNVNIPGEVEANITNSSIEVTQGTDPWVISGNVNVDAVVGNIDGITANVTVVDGGGSITVDGNVGIEGTVNANITNGSITTSFNPTNLDAFGRLRVSDPYTLFDTRSRYFDHDQFASNVVGSGNLRFDANGSTFLMNVTTTGDSVKQQTYRNFAYQPGKSLLVLNTFCGETPTSGLVQRVGYFDENNGIFLEVDGTTINMVIRSKSSGSITYERIPQSSWNGDRLDGLGGVTNPSGHTLNVDRTQILWMDIEWLGVGSVRTGFVINGQFIVCHTFHHANQSGNVTTYMTTASLPIRYEITSSGSSGSLRQICSTVISEGGYSLSGDQKSVATPFGSPVTLPNDDSFLPVISIRLRSDRIESIVLPTTFSVSVSSNDLYAWKIYRKAITSGGTWANVGSDSSVQVNYGPTSISSGDIMDEGFIRSSNQTASSPSNVRLDWERQLMRDPFTNQSYEFVITMATTGTNQDAYASVQFQEVT